MKRVFAVTALIVLLYAVQASAGQDEKIYPGFMGVPVNAQPVPVESYAGAGNPSSTQWLAMVLPLIRESQNGYVNSGWVKVIDQHYNNSVAVRLWSIDRSSVGGVRGFYSAEKESAGSGPQVQTLSFPMVDSYVGSTVHYYYAKIPPTYSGNISYIVSYYVKEYY